MGGNQSKQLQEVYDDNDANRFRALKISVSTIDNSKILLEACESSKHLEFLKVAVEKGANLSITDDEGNTPLHLAAKANNRGAIEFLVTKTKAVNKKNVDGDTPLHLSKGNSCSLALIEAGADQKSTNKAGFPPAIPKMQTGSPNVR